MKKILSLLLVLSMIFSIPVTTTAATEPTIAVIHIFADETWSNASSIPQYLGEYLGGYLNMGSHAWITVRNTSNNTITVGTHYIAPHKTISIGTWGNTPTHSGVWYNKEAKFVYENEYQKRVSISDYMTQSDINNLTNIIREWNDYWTIYNNCSAFAATAWNAVARSSYRVSSGWTLNTPANLASSIKSITDSQGFKIYQSNAAVPYDYGEYYYNSGMMRLTDFNLAGQ